MLLRTWVRWRQSWSLTLAWERSLLWVDIKADLEWTEVLIFTSSTRTKKRGLSVASREGNWVVGGRGLPSFSLDITLCVLYPCYKHLFKMPQQIEERMGSKTRLGISNINDTWEIFSCKKEEKNGLLWGQGKVSLKDVYTLVSLVKQRVGNG